MKSGKNLIVGGNFRLRVHAPLLVLVEGNLPHGTYFGGKAVGMAIRLHRVVNIYPQVIIILGSSDHLQSRGLLSCLNDVWCPDTVIGGEAIMSLLSALLEAEKPVQRCFARQLVKIISVLSLGYTSVPEPLQFVEPMITLLSERMFEVSQPMLHLPIRTPCGMVRHIERVLRTQGK